MNALELNKEWRTAPGEWTEGEFTLAGSPGLRRVRGWVSPCGQFGIDKREDDDECCDSYWVVTGIASGGRVSAPLKYKLNQAQTQRFVELISPLTNWNEVHYNSSQIAELRMKVNAILETHFPKPIES